MAKTSMSQRKTMGRVMHEYAHGELKSGASGKAGKVKNRRNLTRSKRKEATGRTYQQETEGKSHVGAKGKRESAPAMGGKNAKTRTRRSPRQRAAARRNIKRANARRAA